MAKIPTTREKLADILRAYHIISTAFNWAKTPQGEQYWSQVQDNLGELHSEINGHGEQIDHRLTKHHKVSGAKLPPVDPKTWRY